MQEQNVRAIMKRIAACLLVLSLIFTMAGNGTFAAFADTNGDKETLNFVATSRGMLQNVSYANIPKNQGFRKK